LIARHRPKSVFTPADADNVRQRFQSILKRASQKIEEAAVPPKPPMPAPARPKVSTPPPPMARRKRA
jgi:hypothetical protein